MKKIISLLLLSLFLLSACSEKTEPVEEPTDGTRQIESNLSLIKKFETELTENKQKYDNATTDLVKETYANGIKMLEREIANLTNENELLEDTLFYSDEFKTVRGVGVYTEVNESILNEQLLVSSFNNSSLKALEKYSDKITEGAILISAAPFVEDGDKYALISVFVSQDSLNNISLEDISEDDDSNQLYKLADYVKVNNNLDGYIENSGNFDVAPDLFTYYSGKTY